MKRICLILLSLCLILTILFSAFAEGPLSVLYDAGTALLLETDNVTLTGHAVFTYDGQHFKTFDGVYTQNGENSRMDVTLDTPLPLGGSRTGGYTVIANGNQVYGIEMNSSEIFGPQHKPAASSVLSNNNMTQLIVSLGGMVVHLAEGGMGNAVAVSKEKENAVYHLVLAQDETPALLNKALTMICKGIIGEYFYAYDRPLPFVTVDDRKALIATIYEEMHGEPLIEIATAANQEERPADYLRYEAARQTMFAHLDKIEQTTPHSVVVIHAADKSQTTYDSFNDYLLEKEQNILQFEDYSPALSAYVQQHPDSSNPDADMRAYYQQILFDNNCAGLLVESDGNYILCYEDSELRRLAPYTQSITQRICTQLEEVSLSTADITVTLDSQQRLTAFRGQLALQVLDFVGRTHTLTIDFDCTAGGYGTSEVKALDPNNYGVIMPDYNDDNTNG